MSSSEDSDLVDRARRGSSEAVGALFERHWLSTWRAAYGITGVRAMADDIAQDAFERAIGALGRFDGRRPFAAWLHRIAVNRALDVLRREKRLNGLDAAAEPTVEAPQDDAVLLGEVTAAIMCLSAERRAVVVLHHWLGYPLAEVAELLGVPSGTAHSRLARGLSELRERLEVEDVQGP